MDYNDDVTERVKKKEKTPDVVGLLCNYIFVKFIDGMLMMSWLVLESLRQEKVGS